MPRSPELRRLFSKDLSTKSIREQAIKPKYSAEVTSRVERQFSEAESDLVALETAIEQFSANQEQLSDEDFNTRFSELVDALTKMEQRVLQTYEGQYTREHLVNDFTPLADITDLKTFIEKRFLYWVPRKQEIARLLNTAILAQPDRTGPVKIIDVGGGNAGLGQLLVALAREHDIPLEYTIIDPNDSSVEHARAGLTDTPEIKLVKGTADGYLAEHYRDSSEIAALFKDRAEKITAANAKLDDLRRLSNTIQGKLSDGILTEADYMAYRVALQTDFNLAPPDEATLAEMVDTDDLDQQLSEFVETYRKRAQQAIDNFNTILERKLAERPPQTDLVLNSWMTPSIDYTSDIRLLNGAAIAYIIETGGGTGIQPGTTPWKVGQEMSYKPGQLYQKDGSWHSYGMAEVSIKLRLPDFSRNERKMNGVYIQRRKDSRTPLYNNIDAGPVKVSDKYPWEDKLSELVEDSRLDRVQADRPNW